MLPYCIGKYKPKQNNIDFESTGDFLMKEVDKMIVKTQFERIYIALESMVHTKYQVFPENKGIFVYGIQT